MRKRRWPKRMSKYLRSILFIDYPYCGPTPGRSLRTFVRIAKRREARDAWRREHDND